jgi:hypothetical protein
LDRSYAITITADYVALDGFEVNPNNAVADVAINNTNSFPSPASSHLMIINNYIHNSEGSGIAFDWGDYYIIAGNTVTNTAQCTPYGESGISVLWPISLGFPSTNTCTAPNSQNCWENQYYHIQVLENTVSNTGYVSSCLPIITLYNPEEADPISADNWQLQNYFPSSSQPINPGPYPYYGLYMGNVSYGNQGAGLITNSGQNLDVYNNTTYNNGINLAAYPSNVPPFEVIIGGSNVTLANNIFYATNNPPESGATLGWAPAYGYLETGVNVNNNVFYNTTSSNGIVYEDPPNNASDMKTVKDGGNLLAVNPRLTSVREANFIPVGSSPVIGKGTTLPANQNIPHVPVPNIYQTVDGANFSNPPPIGAYNGR